MFLNTVNNVYILNDPYNFESYSDPSQMSSCPRRLGLVGVVYDRTLQGCGFFSTGEAQSPQGAASLWDARSDCI